MRLLNIVIMGCICLCMVVIIMCFVHAFSDESTEKQMIDNAIKNKKYMQCIVDYMEKGKYSYIHIDHATYVYPDKDFGDAVVYLFKNSNYFEINKTGNGIFFEADIWTGPRRGIVYSLDGKPPKRIDLNMTAKNIDNRWYYYEDFDV